MKKVSLFILLNTCIIFCCKKQISDELFTDGKYLIYSYESAFSDSLLDKLHGFHKLVDYLESPGQLAELMKIFVSENSDVKKYINLLESDVLSCSPHNIIAIYSEAYWHLVNKIYQNKGNYFLIKGNKREIRIPLDRIRLDILNKFNEDFLYNPPITLMIDYSDLMDRSVISYLGSRKKMYENLDSWMKQELSKFVLPDKADICSNFPLNNLPIDVEKAFDSFSHTGIDFSDFKLHLRQYKITPKLIISNSGITHLEFILSSTSAEKNSVSIPTPITMDPGSRKDIYVFNALRSLIGNLLRTGISREFTVIIKLGHYSHKNLFYNLIRNLRDHLNTQLKGIKKAEDKESILQNERAILYQIKLIPDHFDCESIEVINQAIDFSKEMLKKDIDEDDELRHRYSVTKIWQQVIIIETIE